MWCDRCTRSADGTPLAVLMPADCRGVCTDCSALREVPGALAPYRPPPVFISPKPSLPPATSPAWSRVSGRQRDALILDAAGRSGREIAEAMGIKPAAVSRLLSRARAALAG